MRKDRIAPIVIVVLMVGIMIYCISSSSQHFKSYERNITSNLNVSEKAYLKEKGTVNLNISNKLGRYDQNSTFNRFVDYCMGGIFDTFDTNINVDNSRRGDGEIVLVDNETREESGSCYFSVPIAKVDVGFFENKKAAPKDSKHLERATGVTVEGTLNNKEKRVIRYNDVGVDWVVAKDADDLVNIVNSIDVDLIVVDKISYYYISHKVNERNDFAIINKSVKKENLCFVTKSYTLYTIVNSAIYESIEDNDILSNAMVKYPEISVIPNESNMNRSREYGIIAIIILLSVIITFYLYYLLNINLYNELKDRMDQMMDAKNELQATLDSVPSIIAKIDRNGIVEDMNKKVDFNSDYSGTTDYVGKPIYEIMNMGERGKGIIDNLVEEAEKNDFVEDNKTIEMLIDKTIMEVRVVPVKISADNEEKFLFISKDVTEEKVARRQMLQDSKMIAVGQLAAGVAHEIRNPLGLIRNYCYVLKTTKDNEALRDQAIDKIESAVATSSKIIENLLNFSRISSNEKMSVNLERKIRETASIHNDILKKRSIELEIDCDSDKEVDMYVDAFNVILVNLLSNSIDAVPEGGRIDIIVGEEEGLYSVAVRDNGVGINEDNLEEIFNPFYTNKVRDKGTGLGLYLVYNEVKRIKGEIRVESTPGKGTTFTVLLPEHY